ncbi:choice-of-anchor D domain-containing protein, partial [candidate division KSB1 bacterium]|nr:choice-of-anchor D domain-containing protein [candidate division KSB1 bacterium]
MKRNSSLIIFSLIILFLLTSNLFGQNAPVITRITASQRTGTNLVDVVYDVVDEDGDDLLIRMEVTNSGEPVAVTSTSGDIGFNITPDTNKTIVWNAGVDFYDSFGDYVVVKLEAFDASNEHTIYSDPFVVDTRIDKPPVNGWQLIADSSQTYNENFVIDNSGNVWCFYLKDPGSGQPIYLKIMDHEGNVIKTETIIGYSSSLVTGAYQTLRGALNHRTGLVWLAYQGQFEAENVCSFLIFDAEGNIQNGPHVIQSDQGVLAPKIASDSSGTMWVCWHSYAAGHDSSRGKFISIDFEGNVSPEGVRTFTDERNLINTDIAVAANQAKWFIYEKANQAGYVVLNPDESFGETEIYSLNDQYFDPRISIYANERNSHVYFLNKNIDANYYRLEGRKSQPPSMFTGINLVKKCSFIVDENGYLEIVNYDTTSDSYMRGVYDAESAELISEWTPILDDVTDGSSVNQFVAYNPDYPMLKTYLVHTQPNMTKMKFVPVLPETVSVAISTDSLDFGLVGIDTLKSDTFIYRNLGNVPIHVNTIQLTDSGFTADKLSFSTAPGDSELITVTFSPQDTIRYESELIISTDRPEADRSVILAGEGYARRWDLLVKPDVIEFDSVAVDHSKLDSLTLVNTGNQDIHIEAINFTDTSFSHDMLKSLKIVPGDSHTIVIEFSPADTGMYTSEMIILSNSTQSPQSIALRGYGFHHYDAMVLEPDTLDYGEVPIGYSLTHSFTIRNISAFTIKIDSINVHNSDYAIVGDPSLIIEKNSSISLNVSFSPSVTGPINSIAEIFSHIEEPLKTRFSESNIDNQINQSNTLYLQGIGYELFAPKIVVVPDILEFDSVRVGATANRSLCIKNNGADTLRISNITSNNPHFEILSKFRSFKLAPADSEFISIRFTPTYANEINGVISILSNDPIEPEKHVLAYGRGYGAPKIYINPPSGINFETAVILGQKSTKSFYISNLGSDTLKITGIRSENENFYALYDTTLYGIEPTLPPPPNEQTIFVSIVFKPVETGEILSHLIIENNDPDSAHFRYPLSGIARLADPPDIVVSADSINFGVVDLNKEVTKSVTIKNQGETTLEINNISMSDPHFAIDQELEFSVLPNDSQAILISFTPDASITYLSEMTILSNDPQDSTMTIYLQGAGRPLRDQEIVLEPDRIDFGETGLGMMITKYLWVKNNGEKDLIVSNLSINNSQFNVQDSAFTIRPGSQKFLVVTFTPQSLGRIDGVLTIISNDPLRPETFLNMNGLGRSLTPPTISTNLTGNVLGFGTVPVNHTAVKYIKIYNNGEKNLNVSNVSIANAQFEIITKRSFSVYPGAYHLLGVKFTPASTGVITANLKIISNAENLPSMQLSLNGIGRELNPAAIYLSDNELKFGDVPIYDEKSLLLMVRNTGENTLDVQLANQDTSAFQLSETQLQIEEQDARYVLVMFKPAIIKNYYDTLTVTSNDPQRSRLSILLSGEGRIIKNQQVTAIPSSINFGDIPVSFTGVQDFALQNSGEKELIVYGMSLTESVFTVESDSFVLQPGKARNFEIYFNPKNEIEYWDTLSIRSNDIEHPLSRVPIRGVGSLPVTQEIVVSPDSIDFADVAIYSSRFAVIDVHNAGEQVLQISRINRTDRENFWIPAEQQSFSVAAGDTAQIHLEFKPIEKKTFEDSIIIVSNDPANTEAVVKIRGMGRDSTAAVYFVENDSVNCGHVALGEKKQVEFILFNKGEKSLHLIPQTIDNPVFRLSAKRFVIPGNDSLAVTIEFQPTDFLEFNATLDLVEEYDDSTVYHLYLSGVGTAKARQQIHVDSDGVNFDQVALGDSATAGIYVSNLGDYPLTIHEISVADSQFRVDNESFKLDGKSAVLVSVLFSPVITGEIHSTLLIQCDDVEKTTVEIPLQGYGYLRPGIQRISASPSRVSFGEIALNSGSSRNIYISNVGNDTLTILQSSVLDTNFSVDDTKAKFNLLQGENTVISVRFHPSRVDTIYSHLVIESNDPIHPRITLGLDGSSRRLRDQRLVVEADSLEFGTQPLMRSVELSVPLYNSGEKVLEVQNIQSSAAQFSVNSTSFSIVPDGYYYLTVRFTPTLLGTQSANITIFSNDPLNESINIVVRGAGRDLFAQRIALSMDVIDFGTTVINRERTRSVHIMNTGEKNLEVTEISINNPQFKISERFFLIAPGDSHTVNLTYLPLNTDTLSLSMTIRNNDPNVGRQNLVVPVHATCVKYNGPYIEINPTTLNFGKLIVGSRKTLSFVVANHSSDSALIISDMLIDTTYTRSFKLNVDSMSIARNDSVRAYLTYSPQVVGQVKTQVTLNHNDNYSEIRSIDVEAEAVVDNDGTNMLSSLSGWYTDGYYPLKNALEHGPDNAWFIKDFHVYAKPKSALLYVGFKDSVNIYINGILVAVDTSSSLKRVDGWNINGLDVTDHIKIGRNRISSYILNKAGQGGYDAVLLVDGSPVIRHSGYYPDQSSVWWYYGRSGEVLTTPLLSNGHPWFSYYYGYTDYDTTLANFSFEPGVGDTTYDSSIHGNQAVLRNVEFVEGIIGSAYQFNGTRNSYVDLDVNSNSVPGTIEFWFNCLVVHERDQQIVSNSYPVYSGHGAYLDNKLNLWIYYHNGKFNTEYQIKTGKWYHLNIVYGLDQITVYLNRRLIKRHDYELSYPLASTNTYIGGNPNFWGQSVGFSGIVDELRLYTTENHHVDMPRIATIASSDTTAMKGNALNLSFRFSPSPFDLLEGGLKYSVGGSGEVHVIPVSLTDSTNISSTVDILIPPDVLTIRGLKYQMEALTDYGFVRFPTEDEDEFAWIPVSTPSESSTTVVDTVYQMFSVPYDLDDQSIAANFEDDFGTYSPYYWRLFQWNPDAEINDYVEYMSESWDNQPGIERGSSVWIVSDKPKNYSTGQGSSPKNNDVFSIELQPGWNQIANPFPYPVLWDSVRNVSNDIGDLIYYRADGMIGYERNWHILEPWKGYFVENKDSASHRTIF